MSVSLAALFALPVPVAAPLHPVTVEQFDAFIDRLNQHNWYYDYQEDHTTWTAGAAVYRELQADAKRVPVLQHAFDSYKACMFRDTTGIPYQVAIDFRNAQIQYLRATLNQGEKV